MMQTFYNDITFDLVARLGLAILAGTVLGLNRWLHHKSAGIRTHSLVALGAAVAMLMIDTHSGSDAQSHSRVLQGLVTGIGFLGAGVIIRDNSSRRIHGLTTAASIWACALLGAAFGAGQIALGLLALAAILLTLLLGGRFEIFIGRMFGHRPDVQQNSDAESN
jgi:putative Mg2+ transporter-C (MgtC) family protein